MTDEKRKDLRLELAFKLYCNIINNFNPGSPFISNDPQKIVGLSLSIAENLIYKNEHDDFTIWA
ncbi:MAG: hypothetical protein CMI54_02555 [Parcubacteria group bacterium]|jgi:hypothetical protein|nr:hypothetical protein [Parcubacteria group bacterium]|tara:strand:+ start:2983 stop:3174 length:192 start_codon:yes stop_codon:yes gene_type:complete